MMPETYINIFLTLVNVATLYAIAHLMGKQSKTLKEFREFLEQSNATQD